MKPTKLRIIKISDFLKELPESVIRDWYMGIYAPQAIILLLDKYKRLHSHVFLVKEIELFKKLCKRINRLKKNLKSKEVI